MNKIGFSIKWKAVTFLSAILLCICTSMVMLYTYTLLQQAEVRASSANTQDDLAISELLANSYQHMQQMAQLIPNMENIKQSLQKQDQSALEKALQAHWQTLSLDLDIHYLHLFDASGQNRGGYHTEHQVRESQIQLIRQQVIQAAAVEQPARLTLCDTQCTLFVIEPFILSDGSQGVIAIGQSIASLVTRFNSLTGRSLAILKPGQVINENRNLPTWGMSIWALSQFNTLNPLIKQSMALLSEPGNIRLKTDSNVPYRIHRIANPQQNSIGNPPIILSLTDITAEEEALHSSIRNGVLSGISGLVLSELFLLLLIWRPTRRLHRLAAALPLLSEHKFDAVRHIIHCSENNRLKDELDLLENTVLQVSDEFEVLQREVKQHAERLEQQMTEQIRARQFMAQLLDTAPLIIITQAGNGQIHTMNHWGRQMTRWTHREQDPLHTDSFLSLHKEDSLPDDYLDKVLLLSRKELSVFQHEAQLHDRYGTLRYITWMHSLIEDDNGEQSILSVGMDLTDRMEAEHKLTWLASHDTLTGLHNRRDFQNHLSKALNNGWSGALLFIDVDRFKSINDTAGHGVGDQVLRKIARILQKNTRGTDFVARLGGDEFTILLPRADKIEASKVMAKMSDFLNTEVSINHGGQQHFSCSIGCAMYPDHGSSDEELLASADMAMYHAKQSGQGRWHLYDSTEAIIHRIQSDVSWQEKIRLAFNDDLFRLWFQPILNINTRKVCHYEVLLRIQMPDGEIILPGDFIPVAERTGLIWNIDKWVLTQTMEYLAQHNRVCPDQPISLAVNISAPSIQSPDFISLFLTLCASYSIPPEQLIIEITETAFLEDFESAQAILRTLAEHGCKIALDDFGVGFSSFSYLKQMPLTYVKLDGSYIREIVDSPQEQTFVRCLTEMVKGFDMLTIGEFVETPEIMQTLQQLGVRYAQGYLIGRPTPVIEDQATITARLDGKHPKAVTHPN
ncbi:EAL domain-containing protein [Amphritea sp. HPY]|uniref:bifunctional diguanylate cyclase/phosphodiesterase n=1 Tax=Amphritea sp. HPY TaxID=3421652 RepID=UPI003D7DA678